MKPIGKEKIDKFEVFYENKKPSYKEIFYTDSVIIKTNDMGAIIEFGINGNHNIYTIERIGMSKSLLKNLMKKLQIALQPYES